MFTDELKKNLFYLMRLYSGAEYALAEINSGPSSGAAAATAKNAENTIDFLQKKLTDMGYSISAFTALRNPNDYYDVKFTYLTNSPKTRGGVLYDANGGIHFQHKEDVLCGQITEEARFFSDRFHPSSWPIIWQEMIALCNDNSFDILQNK